MPEDNKSDKDVIKKIGTRIEVMHGKALQTGGGLKKADLKLNKSGSIVSVRASNAASKTNNLVNAGYVTEKGKFGSVKKGCNSVYVNEGKEDKEDKEDIKDIKAIKNKKTIKNKKDKKNPITFF